MIDANKRDCLSNFPKIGSLLQDNRRLSSLWSPELKGYVSFLSESLPPISDTLNSIISNIFSSRKTEVKIFSPTVGIEFDTKISDSKKFDELLDKSHNKYSPFLLGHFSELEVIFYSNQADYLSVWWVKEEFVTVKNKIDGMEAFKEWNDNVGVGFGKESDEYVQSLIASMCNFNN